MLMELSSGAADQLSLLPPAYDAEKSEKLMGVLDRLNANFGRDTVMLGAAGLRKTWAMKSENRTPRYTTCWEEVPIALAK